MVQQFNDPVITSDERSFLVSAAEPLKVARRTLDKLEGIGFDVSADRELVDRTEAQRAGLLKQFGALRPTRRA